MTRRTAFHFLLALAAAAATFIATTSAPRPEHRPPHRALTIRTGPLQLRAVRAGSGSSMVLLHGFGESLMTWRTVFDRLALKADVVALDLPGFGLSSKQPGGYTPDSMAAAVLEALDRLGIGEAWMVGHSMGGAVATAVASKAPDRVRGLVLLAPAVVPTRWAGADSGLSSSQAGAIRSAIARYEAVRARFLSVHDPAWLEEDDQAMAYTPASDPAYLVSVEAVLRQFDFTYMTPDVARRLTMPVLLIWGELDTTVPIATGRRLRDLLPNARMVSLSGTWHRPQLERPDEVAAAIESFTTGDARQPLADTPPPR